MITKALVSLRPNSTFYLIGETYDGIVWNENNKDSIPTREEVTAEVGRLIVEEGSKIYQLQRLAEYPSYADQFDLLYHGGYDAWKAKIQEVKDKYPKP